MKRSILKTVAVIAAFFIGVSINNSCGESGTEPTGPAGPGNLSTEELWNTVQALTAEMAQLKEEVQRLRQEVDALNGNGGGNHAGNGSGEIFVDGLYFGRDGYVSSKVKRSAYEGIPTAYHDEYTYDDKGRIQSQISYREGMTTTNTYVYSGKTSTLTTAIVYDPDTNPYGEDITYDIVSEYY